LTGRMRERGKDLTAAVEQKLSGNREGSCRDRGKKAAWEERRATSQGVEERWPMEVSKHQ
jgi:hypothetical protein